MKKKISPLIIFACIVASCFFLFTFKSAKQLFHYYSLSLNAPIKITKWDVHQSSKNKYTLVINFIYLYKDKEFTATAPLGISYPNPWAAAEAVKRYSSKEFVCWFSPRKVDHPYLVKKFPLHALLSSLILAGILLYFCGLALYFRRGQREG
jgi:hypothetical protein